MSFDAKRFRQVLGHFPTGVVVVTAVQSDGAPAGMAVGSFTSVSLDPPLVAFLPDRSSTSWPRIQAAGSFCVNILGSGQESVCRTFAVSGGDKFADLGWRGAGSGSPILDGVLAWIDCDIEQVVEAGDHYIVIGRVRELDIAEPSLPLVFFQGGYGRFSPLSLAAWESDLDTQLRAVDIARPEMERVAAAAHAECVASAVVGAEMVLVGSAGNPRTRALPTRTGQRLPFLPPLGTAFVAWSSPAAQQAWLDRAEPGQVDALRSTLDAVRRHGYAVGTGHGWHHEVETILFHGADRPAAERVQDLRRLITSLPPDYESPEQLGGDAEHEVGTVSVPVTDGDGAVVLVLSVVGLTRRSTRAQVQAHAERLQEAARAVSRHLVPSAHH